MKKFQLLIILFIIVILLGLADYLVTKPEFTLNTAEVNPTAEEEISNRPRLIEAALDANSELAEYILSKTIRSSNLFETFPINSLNLTVYKNEFIDQAASDPNIFVYEMSVPVGQGQEVYLKVKQLLTSRLASKDELNATNQYGQNSLFYNNASKTDTVYLLVQIKDNIVGFQYSKTSQKANQFVQKLIETLTTSNS